MPVDPHLPAARTAAERALSGFGGRLEVGTDGVEHAAGLCDDAVDAREVAGIVVDRTEPFGLDVRKTACLHEFVNENSVTDHGPAEVLEGRIFILERIEAVGAGRQDAVEVILGEVSDVFLSSGLVEVFLAESAGELAVAALFGHDGEVDPCGLENPHHAACDLARAAVVAGGAANPVEDVVVNTAFCDRNIKILGPIEAFVGIKSPGIADGGGVF